MAIVWCEYSSESLKRWSGGTTQELFICPNSATVSERNFDFRISTATVEEEQSAFTAFNGYLRKLMVLEGELKISHQDHHSNHLLPFEQDAFSGDWNTISIGKVRDFNVIYRPHLHPTVEAVSVTSETIELVNRKELFVYLQAGSCTINSQPMQTGMALFSSDSEQLTVKTTQNCVLILVSFD